MEIRIVKQKLSKDELIKIAKENYGNMVKVDVDIKKEILAIGGEWHSEGEEFLNKGEGSSHENVWGINFFPWKSSEERIEYNSLVNIKPSIGHKSMDVENPEIKQKISRVVENLLLSKNETL